MGLLSNIKMQGLGAFPQKNQKNDCYEINSCVYFQPAQCMDHVYWDIEWRKERIVYTCRFVANYYAYSYVRMWL